MSVFVYAKGEKTVHAGVGVKKWQNSVHVVGECPLILRGKHCQRTIAVMGAVLTSLGA